MHPARPASGPVELTDREREVLRAAARGLSDTQIALELGISFRTVAKHLQHAYRKLGVCNRTAAVTAVVWEHPRSGSAASGATEFRPLGREWADVSACAGRIAEAVAAMSRAGMLPRPADLPTVRDLEELYRLRELLEVSAVERGRDAAPHRRRALESSLKLLDAAERSGRWPDQVTADIAFHQAVVGLHDNSHFDRLYLEVGPLLARCMAMTVLVDEEDDGRVVVEEHEAIAAALENRDDADAMKQIDRHVVAYRDRVVDLVSFARGAG